MVVVLTKPDPAALLDVIEQHGVTELFLPPTVIYRLLEEPGLSDRTCPRFDTSSRAPPRCRWTSSTRDRRIRPGDDAGIRPDRGAGLDRDASPGGVLRRWSPRGPKRLASCGRPTPLVSLAIMDTAGNRVSQGQLGEICVSGDLVMKGYYQDTEKTAETIVDGWLHTGDIGFLDREGYLSITDRIKDVIISGGFNVYPGEIEQVIWSLDAVQDCSVIGVPDAEWGEAVKAVVELKPGPLRSRRGDRPLQGQAGSVKAPKSIDIVEALPRSPVGKVLKAELRAGYWATTLAASDHRPRSEEERMKTYKDKVCVVTGAGPGSDGNWRSNSRRAARSWRSPTSTRRGLEGNRRDAGGSGHQLYVLDTR